MTMHDPPRMRAAAAVLARAAELITDATWTRSYEAVNEFGNPCNDANAGEAVRFCALGAIRRTMHDEHIDPNDTDLIEAHALAAMADYIDPDDEYHVTPCRLVTDWNDEGATEADEVRQAMQVGARMLTERIT